MPDLDIRILIGGGVVFLLLVVVLVARAKKKPAEAEPPTHVPPNPFDKPPVSGPVSTTPGPTSGQGPASGPISTPMSAGPVSGPISTPGGAPPVSGPISSPGMGAASASGASGLDVLHNDDTRGGTEVLPQAPVRPIEDDDYATQAVDRPPVLMDEADGSDDAETRVSTATPPAEATPSPSPPPPAPEPSPAPAPAPAPPEPVVAKPAPPKPAPPLPKPASDPAIKAPAAPVASKQTTPATPQAMADAVRKEPARPKLPSKPDVPQDAELDFSALRDAKKSESKVGAAAPSAATSPAARFVPASNPETAELEKSDPRHAAARRLARLSVSEIKLYHEAEVKEGREKKDLWKRLVADITLATQTYDKRVDQEVRDRFDYLYDEILRQLAEGNAELLGADAPKPKTQAKAAAGEAAKVAEPAKAEEAKPEAKADAPIDSAKITAPAVTRPAVQPTNPETAELERSDPRHAAARRLARLSVSEIKLYHEAEVKEGREKKDLYTRLGADIALAKQTFEKRVDQEVRDRYDYLYDEILRQLAEGNEELLGPGAPPKPSARVDAKPEAKPEAKAETKVEAKPEPSKPEPAKVEAPKSEPKIAAPKPAPVAEPAKPTMPGVKYAPPSNPETAELEKGDPRHAAARRLARLSVSEIKLYHEAEVKEGREKKDLYTRLGADIALAKQTYEKRVDQEVRDRFDYLYDEILRQLAEGNVELLGKDAPPPKKPAAEPAKVEAPAPASEPKPSEPKPAEPKPAEAKKEEAPKSEPKPAAPAPAQTTQPSAVAKYMAPSNPKTADLEKSDPRHAAARRLARLSVSEIKLYHEAEVKEGREKKDLYTRLGADIALAKQTFEKRVDQEVRDRFDYLYDEIVRQLAEGNEDLLGPGAPPKPASN